MEGQGQLLGRLTEVLERMWTAPQRPQAAPAANFKTPQCDGQGDIEYFIQQFTDVSDANGWGAAAELLHLREALK